MVIRRGQCSSCPLIFDKFVDLRKHEITAHSIKLPQVNTGSKRPKKVKGGAGEVAEGHVVSADPPRSPREVMAQKRRKKEGSNVKLKGKTGRLDNLPKKESKQSTNSKAIEEERPDELAFRERVENYDWTQDWIKFKTQVGGFVAYECKECSTVIKKFSKGKGLSHSFIHSGETPFQCAYCPSKFKRINERISHERIHTGQTPYRCSICHSAFINSSDLQRHESKHVADPKFKPRPQRNKLSGVKFPSNKNNKNSGVKKPPNDLRVKDGPKFDVTKEFEVESSRAGRYRCLQCKAIVSKSDPENLKAHFESHHAKSPFKINPESKLPIRQRISNLRRKTTRGELRPDELAFEKRVKNYDWTQHWIKKTQLGAYKCKECSMVLKIFSKRNALLHSFIHSGETPFQCAYCPSKFKRINDRISHERSHTGETPYRCSICHSAFINSSVLRRHESKHVTDPKFKPRPQRNKLSGVNLPSKKIVGVKKFSEDLEVKDGPKFDVTKEFEVESSRAGRYRCLQCKAIVWKSDPESLRTHFESHPAKSTSKITPKSKLSIFHPEDSGIYKRIRNYDWSNDWKKIKIGSKEVFRCSKCKTTTPDLSDLLLHTFIHTRELPFKCISCPMRFRLEPTRREHEEKHFKVPQLVLIKVENEGMTYPDLVFKGIAIGMKGTGAFEDLGCGTQSEVEGFEAEKSQILKNVEKKSFRINRKKKPNYTSKSWWKIKKDPVKRKFNWTTIEGQANSTSLLKCSSCGKIASSREALRDHEDTHYGMRRYKCWICSKRFQLKSIFSKHLLESHGRNCTKNSNAISVSEPNINNLSTEMGFSENELEELGTILNKWQKN